MKHILKKLEKEIEKRQIEPEEIKSILTSNEPMKNRRIIGGYASVAIIDREGHRITISALKEAVKRHMDEVYFRPVNVFHCLAPETKILTHSQGYKYVPISEIKVGDKVISHTGAIRKVTKTIVHENNGPILYITLNNGELIRVTDEHPILTRDRGWVKAGELTIDDILLHTGPRLGKYHTEESKRKISENRKRSWKSKRMAW